MAEDSSPAARSDHDRDLRAVHAPLGRWAIVLAAMELVDAVGEHAFSMRRLGQQLGVQAMSLYSYVDGRDKLLRAIADRLVDMAFEREPAPRALGETWQDPVRRLALAFRCIALQHPGAFEMTAFLEPEVAWLRSPLLSSRVSETFLARLIEDGLSDQQAFAVYQAFSAFLLGHLLPECSPQRPKTQHSSSSAPASRAGGLHALADRRLLRSFRSVSPTLAADFPLTHRLAPLLGKDESRREFVSSLDELLGSVTRGR